MTSLMPKVDIDFPIDFGLGVLPSLYLGAGDVEKTDGDVRRVEFDGGYNAVASVGGSVLGDVEFEDVSDRAELTVIGSVFSDIEIDDSWFTTGYVGGSVGDDFEVYETRGGNWKIQGAIMGETIFDDVSGFNLSVGQIGDVDLYDSNVDIDATFVDGDVYADDSSLELTGFFVPNLWLHADDSDIEVDIVFAPGFHIGVDDSSLDLSIGYGDGGYVHADDSVIDISIGEGDVDVFASNSDGYISTGFGNDDVELFDFDGIALTGSGNDNLTTNGGRVAYNLGDGNDVAEITGGQTLGNGVDGSADTFIFDVSAGGRHDVQVDQFDTIALEFASGNSWDAETVDAIDGSNDDAVDWGDFALGIVVVETPVYEDDFFGKG